MEAVTRFLKDERGLETVEYAIILGIIVVATIGLIVALGQWVHDAFQGVTDELGVTPA